MSSSTATTSSSPTTCRPRAIWRWPTAAPSRSCAACFPPRWREAGEPTPISAGRWSPRARSSISSASASSRGPKRSAGRRHATPTCISWSMAASYAPASKAAWRRSISRRAQGTCGWCRTRSRRSCSISSRTIRACWALCSAGSLWATGSFRSTTSGFATASISWRTTAASSGGGPTANSSSIRNFWDGLSGQVALRVAYDPTTIRGWTAPAGRPQDSSLPAEAPRGRLRPLDGDRDCRPSLRASASTVPNSAGDLGSGVLRTTRPSHSRPTVISAARPEGSRRTACTAPSAATVQTAANPGMISI